MRAAPVDDFDDQHEQPDGPETVAFLRRRYGLDAMPIRRGLLSTSLVVILVATALGLVVGVSGALLVRAGARTAYDRELSSRTKAAVEPAGERASVVAPSAVGPAPPLPEVVAPARPDATPRVDPSEPRGRPRPEPRSVAVPKSTAPAPGARAPDATGPPSADRPPSGTKVDPPAAAAPAEPAPWVRRVIPPERDTSEKVEPAPDSRGRTPGVTISPWPVPPYLKRRSPPPVSTPAPQPGPTGTPAPRVDPSPADGASSMRMSDPGQSRASSEAPAGEGSRPD
jgi:hypothetical protein